MTSSKPGETPTLTCVCCFRKCPWRKPWTDTSFQRFPSKARATGRCSADVPSLCTSVLVCNSSKMTHARHSSTTTDDACRFFFSVSDFRSPFSKTEGFRQSFVVDFVFVWMSLDGSVGTCRRIVSFTVPFLTPFPVKTKPKSNVYRKKSSQFTVCKEKADRRRL